MQKVKGTLIPIGGNENKGSDKNEQDILEFIEQSILSIIVRECGSDNPVIAVIPTASSIPVEVGENYISAFETLGCTNVHVLNIRKKEDSEKPEFIDLVKKANVVMFSGGDQSKITNKIGGSSIHKLLVERYTKEENFVIAGTSAGAMAMSNEMIAGGSSTEAFNKGAVSMYHGLNLAPQLIFDTHFITRGRFGRLSEAVAKFPNLIGIGLAEDTGLIIKGGNEMSVIGSGMVIVFDGRQLQHNNVENLPEGTPMTLTNMTVHVLANSDKYYIEERRVSVLPIEAEFDR